MKARKPKLAVISPYFPIREEPYRGHSAYQTLRRMTQWADIHAFSPMAVYPEIAWLKPRSYRYKRADLDWSPPDIPATYLEYRVLPYLTRPVNGWICEANIQHAVRAFQPDLILNYWLYPEGYAAASLAKKLGIPSIVCSIGSDLKRIPDRITRSLVKKTLQSASFLITVSEDLRKTALELGARPQHSRTILNGCDTAVFYPRDKQAARKACALPAEAQVITYVGSLIASKGLWELLEAAQTLKSKYPQLKIACIGEGSLLEPMRQRAAAFNLSDVFLFPGRYSSEGVAQWISAADVFCLPSHSEGCPNVVIEAIGCGRPVVATTVGGIPELINEECGALVPSHSAPALASALDQTLSKTWDAETLANRFSRSWEQVAEETWAVCQECMQGSPLSSQLS